MRSGTPRPRHSTTNPTTGCATPRHAPPGSKLLTRTCPSHPRGSPTSAAATGTLSVLLADAGYAVDGVDFSPEMVSRARAKAAGRDGVTFAVADASEPPLEPAAYDAVLCRHVLWALPDQAAALERWISLLGPRGRLVLVEGFWHTGTGLTAAQTEALLRRAGREPSTYPLDDPVLWGGPIA